MNDRGLSLTPTDMLKGYLLANITDATRRNEASLVWRKQVAALSSSARRKTPTPSSPGCAASTRRVSASASAAPSPATST